MGYMKISHTFRNLKVLTTMVIHLKYAAIADGAVMSPRWFGSYALAAHANRFYQGHALRRMTSRRDHSHNVVENHIEQQPVAHNEEEVGHQLTFGPPKGQANPIGNTND